MAAKRPFELGDNPVAQLFNQYGEAGRSSIAEPFEGITTDGHVVPNLFSLASTGASTQPMRAAAEAFLGSLDAEQRQAATLT